MDEIPEIERLRAENAELREQLAMAQSVIEEQTPHLLALEQRLTERTKQAQKASKDMEDFNYAVSHELRAPLRGINGLSRILLEEPIEPAEAKRIVQLIHDSILRLDTSLSFLMNLSRMDRSELRVEMLDLNALVADARREVERETQNRVIDWRIETLPQVAADKRLFLQALVQLFSNAIKFTRPRAQAVIEVSCIPNSDGTAICVRDNGVGFDPTYAGKMFGPMQRFHYSHEFEGNGFGLALVNRIIRRHGGHVWAESELDRGAAFFVLLPNARS